MGCILQVIDFTFLVGIAVGLGQKAAVNSGSAGSGAATGVFFFILGMIVLVVVSTILRVAARSHQ